jgi:hypothetical protein
MPVDVPALDQRRYQDLLNEALARIPVHTPEWTNYGPSDPGRSLVELFCFLTENLLFRANQIPERNRRKFLQLLGVPLQPGSAARGLVVIDNKTGPRETVTLNADLELRAGQVPFQTDHALDVLPIEGRVYYKRRLTGAPPEIEAYHRLLYASYRGSAPPDTFKVDLYESVPLELHEPNGIDLGHDTVDGSLWIALLARPRETPDDARRAIAGKTLSLGIVPAVQDATRSLSPAGNADSEGESLLRYELPALPPDGNLPDDPALRVASYRALQPRPFGNVLVAPDVVEIPLPSKDELGLWQNLDPLESGVGDFPPALAETDLEQRVVTWLRVTGTGGADVRLLWAGINAVKVQQRTRVAAEALRPGTGLPDQTRQLALRPVIPGSVQLRVIAQNSPPADWTSIDDLLAAGSEVNTPDARLPPGTPTPPEASAEVFSVDHEAGVLHFGDGLRGKRPPDQARLLATYDYSRGAAGNVGRGALNASPTLPAGFVVGNPVRTWGGADPETAVDGEKQIARHLQHRERLVSVDDYQAIARRAPGVQIGRLDVLPAFHPDLSPNEPGDAPGVVTLMVLPSFDPDRPTAPRPDRLFINALCRYLDPRRLVTTELVLRGPTYVPIYLSIGINLKSGHAASEVREAVKQRLLDFLAPLAVGARDDGSTEGWGLEGWPLRKAVLDRELMAEASRVAGVLLVNDVLIARGADDATTQIPIRGLELPQVMGISVLVGAAAPLDSLRGRAGEVRPETRIPVPAVPESC